MGLLGTSTTWRSFKVTLSRCGASNAQSWPATLASKWLRISARMGVASFINSAPASIDIAGHPFVYGSGRPKTRQSQCGELSEPAPNSHAYFSTETYVFCANFHAAKHHITPYTDQL